MSPNDVQPPAGNFLVRHKGEVSFLFALGGWIATHAISKLVPAMDGSSLRILQGGFEAGTVGGAADWLAVKMIFDEIKIGKFRIVPASGIIPRKQKAIAKGAGNLVATEWLTPESIKAVLSKIDIADELTEFADNMIKSGSLKTLIKDLLELINSILAKSETRQQITEFVHEKVKSIRAGKFLADNVSIKHVESLLDELVPFMADKLINLLNSEEIYSLIQTKITENRKGFIAEVLIDPIEITETTIRSANILLRDIEYDPQQPIRRKLIENICEWLTGLKENEEETLQLDTQFQSLLENIDLDGWTANILENLQTYLRAQSDDLEGDLQRNIEQWTRKALDDLKANPEWKQKINTKALELIENFIVRNHGKIAEIVEQNLTKISPDELKEQFKKRTYSDMQWIRVNGAVAGFAIGILLAVINWIAG